MHNLSLATAKNLFKIWVSEGHLKAHDMTTIESRIENMEVSVEIGRLPKAISTNYTGHIQLGNVRTGHSFIPCTP